MKSEPGFMVVNMDHFKAKALIHVSSDNALMFERVNETNGKFYTLDARPYMEWFNGIGVYYRFTPDNRKEFTV